MCLSPLCGGVGVFVDKSELRILLFARGQSSCLHVLQYNRLGARTYTETQVALIPARAHGLCCITIYLAKQ